MSSSIIFPLNELSENLNNSIIYSYGIVIKKLEEFSKLEVIWKNKKIVLYLNDNIDTKNIKEGDLIRFRGRYKKYEKGEFIFSDFIKKAEIDLKLLEIILNKIKSHFILQH